MISLIFRILYTLTTFLQTLIVFRIILKVINADSTNSIVSWIYNMTETFIEPFKGIVADEMLIDRFTLELTPIIALLFYAILGFVFVELSKAFRQAN
ncbi:hypothetical protein CVU76_02060 [Candidatus Dojkabacteria bacterium HGW-Dojkabacteria-1]|uniref:YggT family protein n=1 Tax=Candidatus Dojkabacteria bacterium HGW-Dojkabacteria-1 TaxID=2013761 RepID=A0A2N2F3L3_9BACT|nr:MAG: hypothetical protein CVU76_02060 [Candidatus Dojkabacteria bacterium HGW-Dojkabacteria-1]